MTTTATTADEILALVTADALQVDYGMDLLDADGLVVEDLSGDVNNVLVEHQNYADVHGSITMDIARELEWTTARVSPYQTLTGAGLTATWPLGVYLLTTPESKPGETPQTYHVEGYDRLHDLQAAVGDTYVVPAATGYLAAVRQAIIDADVAGLSPLLDGTAEAEVLAADMVWVLDPATPTPWIAVINDLLSAVGYRGLWADASGRFCSRPYQNPLVRTPIITLDVSDQRTNIVGERTLVEDIYDATNWWRFVRIGLDAQPTEGVGMYTVDNSDGGRKVKQVIALDVVSQAVLESRGDAIVQIARQMGGALTVTTGPLPILSHFDVVQFVDPSAYGEAKCQVRSWRMPLDGMSDGELVLEILQ